MASKRKTSPRRGLAGRKLQRADEENTAKFPEHWGGPRLCTRYAFAAAATIIDSGGLETPAQVTNISVGGGPPSTNAPRSVGASVGIKNQRAHHCVEASAHLERRGVDNVCVMVTN